ncbi:MAG: cytochrome c oxidase subunit II [Planctomycetota bacterium]
MSDATQINQPDSGTESSSAPGAALIGFLVVLGGMLLIFANSTGFKLLPPLLPKAISTYAEDMDFLFWVIFWLTGFFFVLTEGLLIYFCIRFRAKDGGKAEHTHGNHKLELIWTFIPGVILFFLAIFQLGLWGDIKVVSKMPAEDDPNVQHIQVFAKQFEWYFRYPGADGEFGTKDDLTTLAELRVPVNKKVRIQMRTRDVLHSFFLPNARLKQDLLPGHTVPQWFEITETGKYDLMCAELCGAGHTRMSGSLIVLSQEDFDAWAKEAAETSAGFGGHNPDSLKREPIWYWWTRRYVRGGKKK